MGETKSERTAVSELGARLRVWASLPAVHKTSSWVSILTLLTVLSVYLGSWLSGNWEMLSDPQLQNSDARTSIFPFHRYDADPSLTEDPIASEMLGFVPLGVHAMYRILVPMTDVFVAPKIVQVIALLVLLWAAALMARSKRTGLAAAAALLFFVLHDWFAIYRVAGGLPRAFGFPVFALWLAAVLTNRKWVRLIAPILAAVTYPSVMLLILAAEGLYSLRDVGRARISLILRRLKRYAIMVALCLVAVIPAATGNDDRGPIYSLEEAKKEPAFGKAGRLHILPFAKPTHAFGDAFIDQLRPRGGTFTPKLKAAYSKDADAFAVVIVVALLLLPLLRIAPSPWLPLAFFSGSAILYALSRTLAFSLYSPERYYSFGSRMAAIALLVVVVSQSWFFLRPRWRHVLRNFTAAGIVLGLWAFTGNGVIKKNGMTIDQRRDRAMYQFIAKLPKDVRFATHPMDGDGIPYYSARATMGSYETLQPWFTDSWLRQKKRATDTLDALYSPDPEQIVAYAEANQVTHLLLSKWRYKRDFGRRSRSFQPLSAHAKRLVRGKKRGDFYLSRPAKDAVIYSRGNWSIVDVAKLRQAIAAKPQPVRGAASP